MDRALRAGKGRQAPWGLGELVVQGRKSAGFEVFREPRGT